MEEAPPGREISVSNGQPIKPREVPQLVKNDEPFVGVEEPEPCIASVTQESERNNELPVILGPIIPTSVALEPLVFNEPSTNTEPIQVPVEFKEPPATAEVPGPIPTVVEPSSTPDEQSVNNTTIYVSPPPVPPTAGRVEQPVAVPVEQSSQLPEPSFGHWSSTLSEIKQKIEPLASATLHRLPRLDQVCVLWLALVTHPYSFYFTTERTSRSCYPAPYFLALIHVPCLNPSC